MNDSPLSAAGDPANKGYSAPGLIPETPFEIHEKAIHMNKAKAKAKEIVTEFINKHNFVFICELRRSKICAVREYFDSDTARHLLLI